LRINNDEEHYVDLNDKLKGYKEPDAEMGEETFGPFHEP